MREFDKAKATTFSFEALQQIADPPKVSERDDRGAHSATMRVMIRPTVVQAMRISSLIADLEVWAASQATCSAKPRVNESGVVAGPGHPGRLHLVLGAVDSWGLGLQAHLDRAQVQCPPAASSVAVVNSQALAVGRSRSVVCVWAFTPARGPRPHRRLVILDVFDDGGVIDSQQPFCLCLRACRFSCKTGPLEQSGIVGGKRLLPGYTGISHPGIGDKSHILGETVLWPARRGSYGSVEFRDRQLTLLTVRVQGGTNGARGGTRWCNRRPAHISLPVRTITHDDRSLCRRMMAPTVERAPARFWRRARRWVVLFGPIVLTLIAAIGSYATWAAGLSDATNRTRHGWALVASVSAGILSYWGGDALRRRRQARPLLTSLAQGQEQHNRSLMLERVRTLWIKGVLDQSLETIVWMELALERRPDAVRHRTGLLIHLPNEQGHALPPGTSISDAFDDMGKALLILGTPGSGKTTLLLDLARALLERAQEDDTLPIPVVFNLASWAVRRPPLSEWLVDELGEAYDVPRKLGQAWVEGEHILPLLDGLDEVATEHRHGCAEAINDFRQQHGMVPMAVCSRTAEHAVLTVQLRLFGAIEIQPLTRSQVSAHLDQIGEPLAGVRAALTDDPALWELLETPLMLSIVTLAYRGKTAATLQTVEKPQQRHEQLFTAYVTAMLDRRAQGHRFPKRKTVHWLSWLARSLQRHNQTEFYLERMQPDWLPTRAQQRLVTVTSGLLVGLMFGLTIELISLRLDSLGNELGLGSLLGLVAGLSYVLGERSTARQPAEQLRWSWSAVRDGLGLTLLVGLLIGLPAGLLLGLLDWLRATVFYPPSEATYELLRALAGGLPIGLEVGLVAGLLVGLLKTPQLDAPRAVSTVTEQHSARHALLGELAFGLFRGLFFGLVSGLTYGVLFWLVYAEFYEMQGFSLAIVLSLVLPLSLTGALLGLLVALLDGLLKYKLRVSRTRPIARSASLFGLVFGLVAGLYALIGRVGVFVPTPDGFDLVVGLVAGLPAGLVAGLFYVLGRRSTAIQPAEQLRWSWSAVRGGLGLALLVGLVTGLFVGLIVGLPASLNEGVFTGLLAGLLTVLVIGLLTGLSSHQLHTFRTAPNEGTRRSARNALRVGLVPGLAVGLFAAPFVGLVAGLLVGLLVGLVTGLFFGGMACLQHLLLRSLLVRSDLTPRQYIRFLDYAADSLFLRKVGGGYIFVHRLLLEHLAAIESNPD